MFIMDEDGTKMSGPVARKVSLFRRAVLRNRRREQSRETVAARGTDAAAPNAGDAGTKNAVKAQQMKIKAAFGDADAA